jgi:hypothetical protein
MSGYVIPMNSGSNNSINWRMKLNDNTDSLIIKFYSTEEEIVAIKKIIYESQTTKSKDTRTEKVILTRAPDDGYYFKYNLPPYFTQKNAEDAPRILLFDQNNTGISLMQNVKYFAQGVNWALAYTKANKMFKLGSPHTLLHYNESYVNQLVYTEMTLPEELFISPIKQLVGAPFGALALLENGNLLLWGSLDDTVLPNTTPSWSLLTIGVKKILNNNCIRTNTFLLMSSGVIKAYGYNENGSFRPKTNSDYVGALPGTQFEPGIPLFLNGVSVVIPFEANEEPIYSEEISPMYNLGTLFVTNKGNVYLIGCFAGKYYGSYIKITRYDLEERFIPNHIAISPKGIIAKTKTNVIPNENRQLSILGELYKDIVGADDLKTASARSSFEGLINKRNDKWLDAFLNLIFTESDDGQYIEVIDTEAENITKINWVDAKALDLASA